MEAAALLAEALLDAILEQRGQLQMLLADPVALIVLLLHRQVLAAAIHLRQGDTCDTQPPCLSEPAFMCCCRIVFLPSEQVQPCMARMQNLAGN